MDGWFLRAPPKASGLSIAVFAALVWLRAWQKKHYEKITIPVAGIKSVW
jgi:hypothetical protein